METKEVLSDLVKIKDVVDAIREGTTTITTAYLAQLQKDTERDVREKLKKLADRVTSLERSREAERSAYDKLQRRIAKMEADFAKEAMKRDQK